MDAIKKVFRDPPISALLAAIFGLAISLFVGWLQLGIEGALVAMSLFSVAFFFCFERYVNKPKLGISESDGGGNGYHPDLRVWGYGMVLGVGLVVLYLFSRVFIHSIDRRPPQKTFASSLEKGDSILEGTSNATTSITDSTFVALSEHSVGVSSLALWHDGLLLFFLSAALAIVMYALVNVSRSEI